MEDVQLAATRRTDAGSAACSKLRRAGRVPAVLYGKQLENIPIAVGARELEHVLREGARMIDLKIDAATEKALIREIQYDQLGDEILHVDFTRVALDEAVTLEVELDFHGTPRGVEEDGGVFEHQMTEIEVSCLPGNIPESITVEVKAMGIGDVLRIQDLVAPEGVEILGDPEQPVASVSAPAGEEETAADEEAEPGAAEPEIIGRGKEEDEDDEEASA